jgi:hypothetical protein
MANREKDYSIRRRDRRLHRAIVLDDGRKVAYGPPGGVRTSPEVVAASLGVAPAQPA